MDIEDISANSISAGINAGNLPVLQGNDLVWTIPFDAADAYEYHCTVVGHGAMRGTIIVVSDGADGTDGTNGTDGLPGADGTNGTDGLPGADGNDGATELLVLQDYLVLMELKVKKVSLVQMVQMVLVLQDYLVLMELKVQLVLMDLLVQLVQTELLVQVDYLA